MVDLRVVFSDDPDAPPSTLEHFVGVVEHSESLSLHGMV